MPAVVQYTHLGCILPSTGKLIRCHAAAPRPIGQPSSPPSASCQPHSYASQSSQFQDLQQTVPVRSSRCPPCACSLLPACRPAHPAAGEIHHYSPASHHPFTAAISAQSSASQSMEFVFSKKSTKDPKTTTIIVHFFLCLSIS